jgi:hypothetical protein
MQSGASGGKAERDHLSVFSRISFRVTLSSWRMGGLKGGPALAKMLAAAVGRKVGLLQGK